MERKSSEAKVDMPVTGRRKGKARKKGWKGIAEKGVGGNLGLKIQPEETEIMWGGGRAQKNPRDGRKKGGRALEVRHRKLNITKRVTEGTEGGKNWDASKIWKKKDPCAK